MWLACTDPFPMLVFLKWKESVRKLRLFTSAWCRVMWDRLTDSRSRAAVEIAEQFADGSVGSGELGDTFDDTILAAARGRTAAGVVATTLADPRLPVVRDQFARNPRLNRALTPLLWPLAAPFGGLRLPIRWFSNMGGIANDAEFARLACEDPVGGGNRVPLRFLRYLLAIRPAVEPEDFDVCPVLLAHPAADRWTTVEASRPFFDRIKGPKELVMLENCGHVPVEEPGVSRLEEAVAAFLAKLTERTAA
jgi:alpha-beta hydrolase superfamily lysophospholipase